MAQSVSGPGKLSRRTDTGPAQKIRDLPDAQYGEDATYKDLQQQAPLAQAPPTRAPKARAASGGAGAGGPQVIPMGAPTQRPNEPVTAGVDAGEGPGADALGISPPGVRQWSTVRDMVDGLAASNPDDSALAYLSARLQGRF